MAVGEYISVSSQRDTEQADVDKERAEQETEVGRERELDELTQIYIERGLHFDLARQVALRMSHCTLLNGKGHTVRPTPAEYWCQ